MLKRLALLAGLLILLAVPRPAFAVLGMCTVTGTVYNVDGSVAAHGTVGFRLPTTQTFSADTAQTSLEPVTLDAGGNLPAGTQVPLGARIFIQVGKDKPVSVVVTNNPANCPLAFGTLVGSVAGGVPIPSTVITSISTINNIPGITDTAVNPPGAGPATLTLSDGYPITFGSPTTQPELSGAGFSPYSDFFSNASNGISLQFPNSVGGVGHNDGQLVWGNQTSPDTDQRDVVEQVLSSDATHSNGHFQLFVADNSGTGLATLGPILDVLPNIQTFNYNTNSSESVVAENTNAGTAAQAYFQAQSGAGDTFMGTRGVNFSSGDVPAAYGFLEAGGGTSGLYLVSDATTGDKAIHFAASGQIAAGSLAMTEDASADFFLTMPNAFEFLHNFAGGTQVIAANPSTGASAQAGYFVANNSGIIGGFSAIGPNANFGSPYPNNGTYVNSDLGPLLLYAGAGGQPIELSANGQGAAGTLNITEDGSDNFFFANSNTTGLVRFTGGGTGQAAVQVISTGNNSQDILQVYPQNITQGVGTWFGGIREIGSNGNNALNIDSQGSGDISLNGTNGSSSGAWSFSSLGTVNNHHTFSALNSGTQPSISSCSGSGTFAMRAGSTDVAGEIDNTVAGTISTSCLINFGAAWGANPVCVCSTWNGATISNACGTNTSTTQMNLWTQASFSAGGHVTWHCDGLINDSSG